MKRERSCLDREQIFYLEHGMMGSREAESAQVHLACCKACRQAAAEYRAVSRALDGWKVNGPSAWFESKLQARLAACGNQRVGFFGLPWRHWLAPASLAAMLVFGMVMVRQIRQPGRKSSPASALSSRPARAVQASPRTQMQAGTAHLPAEAETKPAEDELTLYRNLPVLENYDMLANFDVLSEMSSGDAKAAD
jgi:hypothetical protein